MNIQPLINALCTQKTNNNAESSLKLKLGQQLDVKVVEISSELNRIRLEIAKQNIEVKSNLAAPLQSGQTLKLEVVQLKPALVLRSPEPKLAESKLTFYQVTSFQTNSSPYPATLTVSTHTDKDKGSHKQSQLLARVVEIKDQSIRLELLAKPAGTAATLLDLPYKIGNQPLKPGQWVALTAEPSNSSQPFKIITVEGHIAEFAKRFLPKNESPATTVNQLLKYNSALLSDETVSIALKKQISAILRDVPQHRDLMQSSLIKRIFSESGLFLEAKIARLTSALDPNEKAIISPGIEKMSFNSDLKGHLLKLIQTLKQETAAEMEQGKSPGTLEQLKNLLQKSENSLARLILDQLVSVPKEELPKQQWHIEIPFFNHDQADSVTIEIDKDQHAKQEYCNPTWSVTLNLTPPNLGPLRCKIAFFDNTVNTHFFTEKRQITDLIKNHLAYLKLQLEQSGLKTGHIEASEERMKTHLNRFPTQSLVDEKA